VKSLPHEQAVDLMQTRVREVRVTESFQRNIQDPSVWQYFLLHWAALAVICLSACGLANWRRTPV
jgi:hypothetical protein